MEDAVSRPKTEIAKEYRPQLIDQLNANGVAPEIDNKSEIVSFFIQARKGRVDPNLEQGDIDMKLESLLKSSAHIKAISVAAFAPVSFNIITKTTTPLGVLCVSNWNSTEDIHGEVVRDLFYNFNTPIEGSDQPLIGYAFALKKIKVPDGIMPIIFSTTGLKSGQVEDLSKEFGVAKFTSSLRNFETKKIVAIFYDQDQKKFF